jgi:prepilin-type processing-associated H-X9-DG protein
VDDAAGFIAEALVEQDRGTDIPFAIIDAGSGTVAGSTRYLEIRREHRGLEIGWTWLGPKYQRTGINTECKYLLLSHAFDTLDAMRVQLKTDSRNVQSQKAIERIGAKPEGVLRAHMLMWDGHVRDSAYFSITTEEWPTVKEGLRQMLER